MYIPQYIPQYIPMYIPQFQIPVRSQQFNFNFSTASKMFLVIFLTTEPSTLYYFGVSCWLHLLLSLTASSAANVRQRAAIEGCPSLQTLGTKVSEMTKLWKSREEPRNYPLNAKEFCESLLRRNVLNFATADS